jgi:hypothetical protein
MAKAHLSSGQRAQVYKVLYRLNRLFHFTVHWLTASERLGVLQAGDIQEMIGLTQEVQLEINTLFLDRLAQIELDDHATYGKVRSAMEKRLRG